MDIELMKRAFDFIIGVYFCQHNGSDADRKKLEADLTAAIQQAEAQQSATGEPVRDRCAQCKKAYSPGATSVGCTKCAPGVSVSEDEFKKPIATPEPVDFIVSAVLIKKTPDGFNTQNKLYAVEAASREEAHGKVLPQLAVDFPEHHLHTVCSRLVPSAAVTG